MKILEYFKNNYQEVKELGDIHWSHAVNSREKLERSLASPDIMFIESDIRISTEGEIICAHPPELTSDLTFESLILKMKGSKQGLKLDFKDPEVLIDCLKILREASLKQPVLLNGDVLSGNGAPRTKFVPEAFLALAKNYLPEAVLSLGWTTNTTDPYTDQNINEMLKLLNGYQGEITFPVRACLLPSSWEKLSRLLAVSPNFTLSIWNNEPVSEKLVEWIKNNTDHGRTFYDFIDDNKDPLRFW